MKKSQRKRSVSRPEACRTTSSLRVGLKRPKGALVSEPRVPLLPQISNNVLTASSTPRAREDNAIGRRTVGKRLREERGSKKSERADKEPRVRDLSPELFESQLFVSLPSHADNLSTPVALTQQVAATGNGKSPVPLTDHALAVDSFNDDSLLLTDSFLKSLETVQSSEEVTASENGNLENMCIEAITTSDAVHDRVSCTAQAKPQSIQVQHTHNGIVCTSPLSPTPATPCVGTSTSVRGLSQIRSQNLLGTAESSSESQGLIPIHERIRLRLERNTREVGVVKGSAVILEETRKKMEKQRRKSAARRMSLGGGSVVGNASVSRQNENCVGPGGVRNGNNLESQVLTPSSILPESVMEFVLSHKKIQQMYDWQRECLSLPAVCSPDRSKRCNLVYSLPTSGGKTLVAEILMLREMICLGKDAMIILPFVSIVQEKVKDMTELALHLDFTVEEYAGSRGRYPPRERRPGSTKRSLYVATIEKASSLVNCLLEHGRMGSVGLVVVDELHMLGEGSGRGATLELTLTKLISQSDCPQIVGMSATLSNIGDILDFLQAESYTNQFRPVKLSEYIKLDSSVYEVSPNRHLAPQERIAFNRPLTYPYTEQMTKKDPDHLLGLVSEVIPERSCLIFCATKKNCENLALMLCDMMPSSLMDTRAEDRLMLYNELKAHCGGQVCKVLKKTLAYGVAYHHGGLTGDERRLIEEAYLDGVICLITCTSTLAAGVNLPAKRVILRSPYVGRNLLSRSQYKQMVGRAGRAGLDTSGESILISKGHELAKVQDLVCGPLEKCHSQLLGDGEKGLHKFVLSLVGLKLASSNVAILRVLERSLYSIQLKRALQAGGSSGLLPASQDTAFPSLQEALDRVVGSLLEKGFLRLTGDNSKCDTEKLEVTDLGLATYKGSVDITIAPALYEDLCRAQTSLCLVNHMHLLFLVTPYDYAEMVNPNWNHYLKLFGSFGESELNVTRCIGIGESYLVKKLMNRAGQRGKKGLAEDLLYKRFYVTLMLNDLWRGKSVWDVAWKFDQERGSVQSLLQGAVTFASSVCRFTEGLEKFWGYRELFVLFLHKLIHRTSEDLAILMEIPGIKLGRARLLSKAGLKTLQLVAYCDPVFMVNNVEFMSKKLAKEIIAAATLLIREKAEALQEEAEQVIAVPTDAPGVPTSSLDDTVDDAALEQVEAILNS